MLRWAVIFLIIAIVAALFGFTGIAAGAAAIAKFLFGLFLLLCLIFFILAISAGSTGGTGTAFLAGHGNRPLASADTRKGNRAGRNLSGLRSGRSGSEARIHAASRSRHAAPTFS